MLVHDCLLNYKTVSGFKYTLIMINNTTIHMCILKVRHIQCLINKSDVAI